MSMLVCPPVCPPSLVYTLTSCTNLQPITNKTTIIYCIDISLIRTIFSAFCYTRKPSYHQNIIPFAFYVLAKGKATDGTKKMQQSLLTEWLKSTLQIHATFITENFRSREKKFHRWNFHPLELSFPKVKLAWNIRSLTLIIIEPLT